MFLPNGNLLKFSQANRIRFSAGDTMANLVLTNRHQKPPNLPSLGDVDPI